MVKVLRWYTQLVHTGGPFPMRKKTGPSYVVKRPDSTSYHFRLRVPDDLKDLVPHQELRYSLRTGDPKEAHYRAVKLAREMQGVFQRLRQFTPLRRGGMTKELTKAEIDKLIKEHLRAALHEAEQERISGPTLTEGQLEDRLEALEFLSSDDQADLALRDYKRVSRYVDDLLQEKGLDIDRKSDTYRTLCRELLKARILGFQIDQKRAAGDYNGQRLEPGVRGETFGETETGPTFSEVMNQYAEEQRRAGTWLPKSEHEVMACLQMVLAITGDIPIREIDHATMREVKQTLMSLPPNIRKSPKYRDLSIPEILALKPETTAHPSTINKTLIRASTLFRWAVKNGYMERNPAEGMQIASKKREDEERAAFTKEDLKLLFGSPDYGKGPSYTYWVPLIGLYTGMRLDEICQLHLEDIREVEGVWVFDVNSKGDRKVKTKSSARLIPVHSKLIELGLLRHIESLRKEGHERLFPEIRKRRDGYGHTVSKWFARYRDRLGLREEGVKKDFHSFRHTFADHLKQAQIEPTVISELMGHRVESISLGRYGKRYSPKVLREAVERLEFPGPLSQRENRLGGT